MNYIISLESILGFFTKNFVSCSDSSPRLFGVFYTSSVDVTAL